MGARGGRFCTTLYRKSATAPTANLLQLRTACPADDYACASRTFDHYFGRIQGSLWASPDLDVPSAKLAWAHRGRNGSGGIDRGAFAANEKALTRIQARLIDLIRDESEITADKVLGVGTL